MEYLHKPVLLKEALTFLHLAEGNNAIDCTLGEGGHSMEILKVIASTHGAGKLLAIDLNADTIERARERLADYADHVVFEKDSFAHLSDIVSRNESFKQVHGILIDFGLSTYELKEGGQGFSFEKDEPLDMRLDRSQDQTAADVVNQWPEDKLIWIFQEYSQENFSKYIAAEICRVRRQSKILHSRQLTEIVLLAIRTKLGSKKKVPWVGGRHPATKVFQALRIAVNNELENVKNVLPQALDTLRIGGRLVVISFHSLEDRIVKNYFRQESRDCLCPPERPTCTCNHTKRVRLLTKKVITPSDEEKKLNPASRSAKLRAVEKIT
ncbi:16S rRNA (cytosine(1402)-N(4))-methyltransferase RsmH [Patescibacteria group bacterium]